MKQSVEGVDGDGSGGEAGWVCRRAAKAVMEGPLTQSPEKKSERNDTDVGQKASERKQEKKI